MDFSSKSATTHKHFHYHYHYDINDKHLSEEAERYSSPSLLNSKKSHTTPYKASWKNHINPEVTKIYEDISVNESFDGDFTPKASRISQRAIKEHPNTPDPIQSRRSPRSRAELFQDIQAYEEYLKKHCQPNLYVPNTPTLKRMQSSDSQQFLTKKFVSLNQLLGEKEKKKKTLEEMFLARTESKIISSKQQISTMHETQNPNPSEMYFSKKKRPETQNHTRQSEIKSPTSSSNIFEKARIRMSHIEDPTHRKKTEELENSNFSLFQREAKKEQSGKNSEVFEHQLKNESQNLLNKSEMNENLKNAGQLQYALELMREECNFLRNKYIEHAENEHGVKM